MSKLANTLTWIGLAVIGVPIAFTMCTVSDNYNKYSDRAEEIKANPNTTSKPTVENAASIATTETKKQAVVDYFISENEPTVKDALWSNDHSLLLGVIDDGTNRNGIANYACQVLIDDFGISSANIYIVDIVKITNGGKWEQLGSGHC